MHVLFNSTPCVTIEAYIHNINHVMAINANEKIITLLLSTFLFVDSLEEMGQG